MSKVMTPSCPSARPRYFEAVTPPDGPERSSRTGARPASAGVITLPLESSRSRLRTRSRASSSSV